VSVAVAPQGTSRSNAPDWLLPVALILLSMVPAIAGTARLTQLASDAPITLENARFIAAPLPVALHIVAAITYSFIGAFQLSPALRRRHRALHRSVGRLAIPTGLIVAVSGLWMTLTYPWPQGDGTVLYLERLIFGGAMLLAILLGVDAIRRRNFVLHGAWMMRAYAIGLGAGTQVLTHLPWFIMAKGRPGEMPRAIMMGAGWVINLAVAEWMISKREKLQK
jgi:uncharacterized membrane protein